MPQHNKQKHKNHDNRSFPNSRTKNILLVTRRSSNLYGTKSYMNICEIGNHLNKMQSLKKFVHLIVMANAQEDYFLAKQKRPQAKHPPHYRTAIQQLTSIHKI